MNRILLISIAVFIAISGVTQTQNVDYVILKNDRHFYWAYPTSDNQWKKNDP